MSARMSTRRNTRDADLEPGRPMLKPDVEVPVMELTLK